MILLTVEEIINLHTVLTKQTDGKNYVYLRF